MLAADNTPAYWDLLVFRGSTLTSLGSLASTSLQVSQLEFDGTGLVDVPALDTSAAAYNVHDNAQLRTMTLGAAAYLVEVADNLALETLDASAAGAGLSYLTIENCPTLCDVDIGTSANSNVCSALASHSCSGTLNLTSGCP